MALRVTKFSTIRAGCIKIIAFTRLERAYNDGTGTNILCSPTKDSNSIEIIIQATVQLAVSLVKYNADGHSFFAAC